jgi:HEAT repeat protein
MSRGRPRRIATLASVLALLLGAPPAPAQDAGDEQVGPDRAPPAERLFLPTADALPDALRRVDDLAARGQWDRVVELLDKLLLEGRDQLAPPADGADAAATLQGARAAVRARLAALPPEGRAVYAQLHDDAALRLLEAARDRAALGPLLEVVARHPGSRAVFAARTLLASRFLERGQPAAALAQLDALLDRPGLDPVDRGRLERARVVALSLLGRAAEAQDALARLGGEAADLDLAARVAAVARAQEAAPVASPAAPATKAWAQPVHDYYETAPDGGATRPWSVPALDPERAYVHDGSHALAVDLATGKLAWRVALRPEDAFKRPAHEGDHRVVLAPGLVVCLVPGVGVIGLERETGRERWRRGLPGLKREAELDFPARLSDDLCLTGPRLTLALVTEHETREVHVLALEVETGALAWTALVASQSQGPVPQVELVGTDERVIVITGLGLVAALDQDGELVWARRYESVRDERDRRGGGGIPGMPRFGPDGLVDGPVDQPERAPSSLVVRGTVWGAPADAKKLWAWDLRTGEVEAVLAQPEGARLVAARGVELVLLSAQGDVHVATKAGARLVAQVGGVLVGWPALAGDRVYVPRTDGIVEVDLRTKQGRQVAPAGREWGHLAGADGLVVSAAPSGLFAFGRDPGPAPALDDPIVLLGDPRFAAREVATAALLAQGEAARDALTRAGADASDPEVRQRARALVAELDRKDRLARWGPIVKAEWAAQVPDLLNRLTHPNPEVRLESLRELGALTDPEVGKLFAALLEDQDERVGYAVAAALLERGDRAGVEHLARAVAGGLLADRVAALRVLTAHGAPDDVSRCAPGLADADEAVRAAAVTAVLALDANQGLPLIEPLVKDEADAVRVAILEALAKAPPHPAGVRVVVALSRDRNDLVRLLAVTALAKTPDASTFGALGHLLGDKVPAIAQQALVALNSVAQKQHVLLIPADAIERAARGKDTQFRDHVAQIAVRFLGRGGVLSVPTLTRFISDDEKQIRAWRVGGRGWQGLLLAHVAEFPLSPGDVAAVGSLIVHEEADVRIKGYQVLGTAIFAEGAGALLAQGLDDEHPAIRRDCGRWLTRAEAPPELLDAAAAHEVLRIATLSLRPEGQAAAKAVLERVPRPALVPALLRALATPNEALRAAAGARLAALASGTPSFDAAQDPVETARAFHTWWWREVHPGEKVEDVVRRLDDDNPTVRWRAAQALATLPTPHARNALAASLAREQLGWVLEAKLEALTRVLGEPLGFRKGMSPAEQRACADRLRVRVVEQIQDELRPRGAPR